MSDDQFDVFKEEDYGIGRSKDLLTRLWRQILSEIDMDPLTMTEKMNSFMRNPKNRHVMQGRSMQSLRGNLRKALLKEDHLSWRGFERGLVLLQPEVATFEVQLKWPNGKTTVHTTQVKVHDAFPEDEIDEDELPF